MSGGQRDHWSSRIGFIFAAAGSAIGLGNLWKFPYITYENGGGAFVIVYLVAIAVIGLPIMLAELLVGKSSQKDPVGAFRANTPKGSKLPWFLVGLMGITAGFVILSFYSVVAGWTLEYTFKGLTGQFAGLTPVQSGKAFVSFLGSPTKQLFYHFVFSALTVGVVIGGVSKGIERTTRILMPVLFGLLLLLMFYSASTGAFLKSVNFLFRLDFHNLTAGGVLEAVGHAFFTLSLGMGAMLTYGSYLSPNESIVRPAIIITLLDTLVALVACMIIYPIVLSNFGLNFGASIGILFTALPVVLMKMPGGAFIAPVFFLLVGFAALSSTISLLEVVVSFGVDERGWSRKTATLLLGGLIFLFGVPSALCNGAVGWFSKLQLIPKDGKYLNWFDSMDYLASNWMLPLGGLFIAIFVGWVMPAATREKQFEGEASFQYPVFLFFLRYVAPVAVGIVLLNKIGIINFEKPKAHPAPKARKAEPPKRAKQVPTKVTPKTIAPKAPETRPPETRPPEAQPQPAPARPSAPAKVDPRDPAPRSR